MRELTVRQQQCLDVIRESLEKTGSAPTRPELARSMGVRSVTTVDKHLRSLARVGHIRRLRGKWRNIVLATPEPEAFQFLTPKRCADPFCESEFYGESCPCGRKP
jgi:SOS-response transcriptional repressor LexA